MIYGFYGGKFLPMHKGHLYCIDVASRECDKLTVIMFINGNDELNVLKEHNARELSVEYRLEQLKKICNLYDNVEVQIVDCNQCKFPDGSEDWDAETPLVRQYVPKMDYVYSSEYSYDDYFKRAYPEATHHIVDAERKTYPISATMIRAMQTLEEKQKWMI